MDRSALQHILLELYGGAHQPDLSNFSTEDWTELDRLAAHDWLQPMLHARHRDNPLIPADFRECWRAAARLAAMAALTQQAELHDAVASLEAGGLAPLALKGAWLAWHAYPAPALRPMSDIDLLLDAETVLAGFALLQSVGYDLVKPPEMPLTDVIRFEKHLPPLRGPRGTIIELHHRLWEPDGRLDHATPEGDEAAVRNRAVRIGTVAYPAPEDMFVHLIVHGAYSHRLGCGPRVLTDLAMLLEHHAIDWPRFWDRAAREGWREGARLLLDLTADYCGTTSIVLTAAAGPPPPASIRAIAPALLLQDSHTVASASFLAAVLAKGPGAVWRRLRGARGSHESGTTLRNTAREGGFMAWAQSRLRRTFGEAIRPEVIRQSHQLAQLSRWLDH